MDSKKARGYERIAAMVEALEPVDGIEVVFEDVDVVDVGPKVPEDIEEPLSSLLDVVIGPSRDEKVLLTVGALLEEDAPEQMIDDDPDFDEETASRVPWEEEEEAAAEHD